MGCDEMPGPDGTTRKNVAERGVKPLIDNPQRLVEITAGAWVRPRTVIAVVARKGDERACVTIDIEACECLTIPAEDVADAMEQAASIARAVNDALGG